MTYSDEQEDVGNPFRRVDVLSDNDRARPGGQTRSIA